MRGTRDRIVALAGGIGGAKLALGLARVLAPGTLAIIGNTGDDFEHLGLSISPDLDTLLYTLAGLDNPDTGWGRAGETWNFMAALEAVGGATWFRLGDADLALHVERTRRLRAGESLSAVTEDFRCRFGIAARILPMSDDPVRTRLRTTAGWLDFQDYFVRLKSEPAVLEIAYAGSAAARASPDVLAALADPRLRAVVICPSNPFLSIAPILGIPGLRDALRATTAPVVAVSPIIAGRAVKGPTAKIMTELGLAPSALAVARHYGDLINAFVVDFADETAIPGLRVVAAKTLMTNLADKEALARTVLRAADDIGRQA
jgi:LPPG:FO 2-phospho-L-lactate transferase